MAATPDPLALHPDGSALDPAAFRAALLGDPAAVADLASSDPAALAVLRSGADGPLQELLKAVYAVRLGGKSYARSRGRGARARARERGVTRVGVPLPPPHLSSLSLPAQEEKRRAEHQARTMSERTIDAQRASAPVPRCVKESERGGEDTRARTP